MSQRMGRHSVQDKIVLSAIWPLIRTEYRASVEERECFAFSPPRKSVVGSRRETATVWPKESQITAKSNQDLIST